MALAGIDMALWDAHGTRKSSASLVRLLGFQPRRMQAYGAVGFDGVGRLCFNSCKLDEAGIQRRESKDRLCQR